MFEYDATGELVCTFIGDVWFDGDGLFGPGEEKLVIVRFAAIPIIEQYMHQGRKWWLHEGRRVIAEAEILEVSSGLKDDARNNF